MTKTDQNGNWTKNKIKYVSHTVSAFSQVLKQIYISSEVNEKLVPSKILGVCHLGF